MLSVWVRRFEEMFNDHSQPINSSFLEYMLPPWKIIRWSFIPFLK